uniref:2Fe-2S iron-sulfur cluster-binding protein n=1 Tax=Agrobacterium fabrum TaxID=1176649 RepID=UPI00220A27F2|nr:2Fe-2S iron-sulfur cluster-binding protein [Agrobacterium fabrum]UVZ00160.1 hypothetical protein K4M19_00469 [Agrobacterium fabrum]
MLATALLAAGSTTFGNPSLARARAPYCLMGVCFECLVTVDGVQNRRLPDRGRRRDDGYEPDGRAHIPEARDKRKRDSPMSLREVSRASDLLAFYDLLRHRRGPAGMAAAVEASAAGARVTVLDENPVRADRSTARSHETVPTKESFSVPTIGRESRSQKRSV